MEYRENQRVALTAPHRSADVYLGGEPHTLAQGKVGTIIDVLQGGQAFEVEFDVDGEFIVTLAPEQIRPAP